MKGLNVNVFREKVFRWANEKIRLNYYDTSGRIVFKTPKRHFGINWPLDSYVLCKYKNKVASKPWNFLSVPSSLQGLPLSAP